MVTWGWGDTKTSPTSRKINEVHSCCQLFWDYPFLSPRKAHFCLRCDLLLCGSVCIHATLAFISLMSAFLSFAYCVSLVFTEHAEARAEAIISKTRAHTTNTHEHQILKCGFLSCLYSGEEESSSSSSSSSSLNEQGVSPRDSEQ